MTNCSKFVRPCTLIFYSGNGRLAETVRQRGWLVDEIDYLYAMDHD